MDGSTRVPATESLSASCPQNTCRGHEARGSRQPKRAVMRAHTHTATATAAIRNWSHWLTDAQSNYLCYHITEPASDPQLVASQKSRVCFRNAGADLEDDNQQPFCLYLRRCPPRVAASVLTDWGTKLFACKPSASISFPGPALAPSAFGVRYRGAIGRITK
ncbi:hypothetical protein LIA77_04695 [Sarocladium implicatum]|nr:hypothetical protein LIA77_04695 [Sarocladium implicatum]